MKKLSLRVCVFGGSTPGTAHSEGEMRANLIGIVHSASGGVTLTVPAHSEWGGHFCWTGSFRGRVVTLTGTMQSGGAPLMKQLREVGGTLLE